jgi:hypothetical protein
LLRHWRPAWVHYLLRRGLGLGIHCHSTRMDLIAVGRAHFCCRLKSARKFFVKDASKKIEEAVLSR